LYQTWIQDLLLQDQDQDSEVPRPRPRLKTYKTNTGVGIRAESIGIEVVAITPCESMEGLTVSMTVSE